VRVGRRVGECSRHPLDRRAGVSLNDQSERCSISRSNDGKEGVQARTAGLKNTEKPASKRDSEHPPEHTRASSGPSGGVAKRLQVSPRTIRRAIDAGELEALDLPFRVGLRVRPKALEKLYQENLVVEPAPVAIASRRGGRLELSDI